MAHMEADGTTDLTCEVKDVWDAMVPNESDSNGTGHTQEDGGVFF